MLYRGRIKRVGLEHPLRKQSFLAILGDYSKMALSRCWSPCEAQRPFVRIADGAGSTPRVRDDGQYAEPSFAGAANVLAYLGRYTHKSAIANHRLVDFDAEHVRFRWRDYAHGNKVKVMRLDAGEFIRRFLLHVLPRGFTRLRHYGLLGNRGRARKLALCRALLAQPDPEPREPETPEAMMLRLTGIDITVCRQCGRGTLRRILVLASQIRASMRVPAGRPP